MSEKNYFISKINDMIRRAERGDDMVFSAFMTPEETEEAANICKKAHIPYLLYGGYEEAERKMLSLSSMDEETLRFCYPIVAISIDVYEQDKISNRDILGALMGSGIKRECIGDIISRDGVCLFFAVEQIASFLIENIDSIGRQKAMLKRIDGEYSIPPMKFLEERDTIASNRLDAVVSSLMRCSREQACKAIELGNVLINHKAIDKKTKEVTVGDKVIIRGFGKWIITECDALTKKGRIILKSKKYI